MNISRNFTFTYEDDFGSYGLRPDWVRGAQATSTIGHDMLEHIPRETDSGVHWELMALGVYTLLRLDENSTRSSRPKAENLLYGLADLMDWGLNNKLPEVKASRRLDDDYSYVDDLFKEAIALLPQYIRSDMPHIKAAVPEEKELQARLLPWLRIGYRRALKHYDRLDHLYIGTKIFDRLNQCSENLLEEQILSEGDRVRFRLDLDSGNTAIYINDLVY